MPIQISTPRPATADTLQSSTALRSRYGDEDGHRDGDLDGLYKGRNDDDDDDGDGDVLMRDNENQYDDGVGARVSARKGLFTPGEVVTDDPQWMR